ncbi:two-component system sensor histidine kinase CreC [Burkholderiaceae bacterium DAT-1]|nr:two-component system sensor histidine kinase CreC [Burkholderiaceae bacterium DAT-1]
MRIRLRIFLGYFLVVGITAWFLVDTARNALKPALRQAMEDSLLDSANLLAEQVRDDIRQGMLAGDSALAQQVGRFQQRHMGASIWGVQRDRPDYRIYVTDARGIVLFDSSVEATGQDYSRWNDVYLTLHGRYGARATQDPNTGDAVLHVAAPVLDNGKIIGVVTVAKPAGSVEPYFVQAYRGLTRAGQAALALSLLAGLLLSWWLTRTLHRLVDYTAAVSRGERNVTLPPLHGSGEVALLGQSIEHMREELEGKRYAEEYVHALTHELKSPLAAIKGAAELINEQMPEAERQRFLGNIAAQSDRMTRIIERLLDLAKLEGMRTLAHPETVDLVPLVRDVIRNREAIASPRNIVISLDSESSLLMRGDAFLLSQAIGNLLDNAIDFSPEKGLIDISLIRDEKNVQLTIRDHGPGVPDFARDRIFERFYSLPRPDHRPKSTGLGLPFVREVASLHGGHIRVVNAPDGGAVAELTLAD